MSPVQLIANRETLIRARSKACDLVIKFFFAQHYNLSTTRALTKCPAWQDIICQMFCVERLPASILSPTTLSSQQRNAIVSNSSNPKFNAGNYDDEDVWENIEYQNGIIFVLYCFISLGEAKIASIKCKILMIEFKNIYLESIKGQKYDFVILSILYLI